MSSRFAGRFGGAHSANNPAREPVPVWEQEWVLPTPTSRIKVRKWVKSSANKVRTFPETEDARYIYASSTNTNEQPDAPSATSTAHATAADAIVVDEADAQINTTGATTSDEAAQVQPAAVEDPPPPVPQDSAALGEQDGPGDETQGGHLFDETMKPAEDDDGDDDEKAGADDVTKDAKMATGEQPAAQEQQAPTPAASAPAPAEEEEQEEEEEEEEEAPIDKHATIRIGGPPPASTLPSAGDDNVEPPAPQISSQLHPQPQGTEDLTGTDQQLTTADVEKDPAAAVDIDPEGQGGLTGLTTTTRDDPEVKDLGADVEAVVHEQPDGVQQVKIVED